MEGINKKRNKRMKLINYLLLMLIAGIAISSSKVVAQINPLGAMYFQNQYLGNAAYAGIDSGINISTGLRQQLRGIPGGPRNQAMTGEYRFGKVGLGLNFYNEKAGLISSTRTVATYAYHLPLGAENQQLHLGLSLGFLNERINDQEVIGTGGDVAVGMLNQRQTYIDSDFGMAYTAKRLTIQGALPNMKSFFAQDDRGAVNWATFFTAVSYMVQLGQGQDAVGIEPKLSYRGINGLDNIVDLGSNVTFAGKQVSVFGMFHSTGSTTFGFGLNYRHRLSFQGIYTTETSAIRGNTNGNFEINLKARVW